MSKDTIDFFKELKNNRPNLTVQQYRTIKGQAVKGNIMDARKGLHKVLKRPAKKSQALKRNFEKKIPMERFPPLRCGKLSIGIKQA